METMLITVERNFATKACMLFEGFKEFLARLFQFIWDRIYVLFDYSYISKYFEVLKSGLL